jgi:hypothetical protein
MENETQPSIMSELANFMVSRPTLEEILDYEISPSVQSRIDDLVERNRDDQLTPGEYDEMTKTIALSHFISLTKAKARFNLEARTG